MDLKSSQRQPGIVGSPSAPVLLTSTGRTLELSMSLNRGRGDLIRSPGQGLATAADVEFGGGEERTREDTMASLESALSSVRSRSPRRPPPTGRSQTKVSSLPSESIEESSLTSRQGWGNTAERLFDSSDLIPRTIHKIVSYWVSDTV